MAGHSVGGFVTAQLLAAHPELKAAVLLTPCDLGGAMGFADDTEPKRLLLDIFEGGPIWLNGTSPAALYGGFRQSGKLSHWGIAGTLWETSGLLLRCGAG